MVKIYDLIAHQAWDDIVRSFADYDVYYLSGYVRAFYAHGDGEPQLLYYTSEQLRAIYVYMKRPTTITNVYDSVTPYGYGGVLFEGDKSDQSLSDFWKEYVQKMNDENIIVRAYSMLDRRLGKRRLKKLHFPEDTHPLIIDFYKIRCEVECIIVLF